MPLKPYAQLVRLPNVFTAAADSLAGWILVSGGFGRPDKWIPLVCSSMALYAGGIALNDVFDYGTDLRERPNRPLPSGRISRGFASRVAVTLLILGLGLSASSGSLSSVGVATLLLLCIVGYDAGLKRSIIGPFVMGACRGFNVLLGMSQAADFGGPTAWLVAFSMSLFVAGVTWISRWETLHGDSRGAIVGIVFQNAAILGLTTAAMNAARLPLPSVVRRFAPWEGLAVLLVVALFVNFATGRAIVEKTPLGLQRAVKIGVFSLVWLNVGVVAAVRGPAPSLAVAALWVPAVFLGRWIYAT